MPKYRVYRYVNGLWMETWWGAVYRERVYNPCHLLTHDEAKTALRLARKSHPSHHYMLQRVEENPCA